MLKKILLINILLTNAQLNLLASDYEHNQDELQAFESLLEISPELNLDEAITLILSSFEEAGFGDKLDDRLLAYFIKTLRFNPAGIDSLTGEKQLTKQIYVEALINDSLKMLRSNPPVLGAGAEVGSSSRIRASHQLTLNYDQALSLVNSFLRENLPANLNHKYRELSQRLADQLILTEPMTERALIANIIKAIEDEQYNLDLLNNYRATLGLPFR